MTDSFKFPKIFLSENFPLYGILNGTSHQYKLYTKIFLLGTLFTRVSYKHIRTYLIEFKKSHLFDGMPKGYEFFRLKIAL